MTFLSHPTSSSLSLAIYPLRPSSPLLLARGPASCCSRPRRSGRRDRSLRFGFRIRIPAREPEPPATRWSRGRIGALRLFRLLFLFPLPGQFIVVYYTHTSSLYGFAPAALDPVQFARFRVDSVFSQSIFPLECLGFFLRSPPVGFLLVSVSLKSFCDYSMLSPAAVDMARARCEFAVNFFLILRRLRWFLHEICAWRAAAIPASSILSSRRWSSSVTVSQIFDFFFAHHFSPLRAAWVGTP